MNLVDACRTIGSDLVLVQGPGGNLSEKTSEEIMVIKASGSLLRDVSERTGTIELRHRAIIDYLRSLPEDLEWSHTLEDEYLKVMRVSKIGDAMPSLETGFHAILSRAVVHTHPLLVNACTCSTDGPALLRELFPDAILIPYATVGVVLSRKILSSGAAPDDGRPIFLLNHGLITHAADMDAAIAQTRLIVGRIAQEFERRGIPLPGPMSGDEPLPTQHVFPDSAIYCSAPSGSVAAKENAYAAAYLASACTHLGGPVPLPGSEIGILGEMASEKYRKERER